MNRLGRLLSVPLRVCRRLRDECVSRRGRRRLRRRLASRSLLTLLAVAWTYPFVGAFWLSELTGFVSGRVVVSGPPEPLFGAAVVLVPAPAPGVGLAAYARIDPARPVTVPATVEDAALWLWTDVDGWFDAMHLAQAVPYRVEVRRPGCEPVAFGVRSFHLFGFSSRRLRLEIPRCVSVR